MVLRRRRERWVMRGAGALVIPIGHGIDSDDLASVLTNTVRGDRAAALVEAYRWKARKAVGLRQTMRRYLEVRLNETEGRDGSTKRMMS